MRYYKSSTLSRGQPLLHPGVLLFLPALPSSTIE